MINKELWFCITKKPPFYEVEQMNTCCITKKPPFYEVEQMNTCTYSLCTQL